MKDIQYDESKKLKLSYKLNILIAKVQFAYEVLRLQKLFLYTNYESCSASWNCE